MKGFLNLLNAQYAITKGYGLQMAAIAWLIMNRKRDFSPDLFHVSDVEMTILEFEVEEPESESNSKDRVAVIRINGPLFRNDQFCGPKGMMSIAQDLKKLDQDESIDAIVLDMYTPGGQVHGTETLANVVANLQKPAVIYGEMICSGGFYIAAGGDHIMLSGKNAVVGSIGSQISYMDFSKHFKDKGIEYIQITADTSPDKNSHNFENPSDEDKAKIAADILNPIDQHFMDHVREHLPGVNEEGLSGKVYYASQAIELGLAHSIGTLEDAIQLALDMAGKKHSEKSISMKTEDKKTAEEKVQPTVESLQELITARDVQIKTLNYTIETKDATIQVQAETIKGLQAEVDRLAKLPADEGGATVKTETDAGNKLPQSEDKDPMTAEAHAMIRKAQADAKRRNN